MILANPLRLCFFKTCKFQNNLGATCALKTEKKEQYTCPLPIFYYFLVALLQAESNSISDMILELLPQLERHLPTSKFYMFFVSFFIMGVKRNLITEFFIN